MNGINALTKAISSTLLFFMLLSTGYGAVNMDYPIEQTLADTGERFTIQVLAETSKQKATEEAIYVSSFLNLPIFIVQEPKGYSLYAGQFFNQLDAPHYQTQLKQSSFRKAAIKRKEWTKESEVARFNSQYLSRYDQPPQPKKPAFSNRPTLKDSASKRIGEQPDEQEDMWISVPSQPRLEQELRKGWSYMSQNDYNQACQKFSELRSENQIRAQATYALGTCYHRSAQPSLAIPMYKELIINNKRPDLVLLPLAEDLEAIGKHNEAKIYRNRHEDLTKDRWTGYQKAAYFKEQLTSLIQQRNTEQVIELLKNNEEKLNKCESIDSFFEGANYLNQAKQYGKSKYYLEGLFEKCENKWHLRVGLLHGLTSLSTLSESLRRIKQEQARPDAPSNYKQKLSSLDFNLHLRQASNQPKGSQDAYDLLMKLNERFPNRHQVVSNIGWWHYENENYEQALAYLEQSNKLRKSPNTERGIIYCLIQLGEHDKALILAGDSNFKSIELDLLKDKFSKLAITDPKTPEMANKILALEPDYLPAQRTLAWHYYETGSYTSSKEAFAALHQAYPEDMNLLKGHVYSLLKLGEIDQTEQLIEAESTRDKDINLVASGIYMDKAVLHYEQENYTDALNYINQHLELEPQNKDALALRSWIHFHKNEREKAIEDLEVVWQNNPTPENTRSLLFMYKSQYEKTPEDKKYQNFLIQLESSNNKEWHKMVSNEFAEEKDAITASQIAEAPEESYFNANATQAHVAVEYRDKSGDKGTSKLQSLGIYLGADIFSSYGKTWRLQLGWEQLNAGSLPPSPFIGRAFLSGTPGQPVQAPNESDTAKRIWIQHWSERGILKYAAFGTTALNSLVDVQPVFEIEGTFNTDPLGKRTGPTWNIHQRLVDQTLLSYVGQHDPYTQSEWGRVLQLGATLGNQWTLTSPHWLSGTISGDYYFGEHVWENWSIEGNLALGRTDQFDSHQRSWGLYLNASHFDKDQNHFTYGHGGYYSPQILLGAGPFAAFEAFTKDTTFWWKAEISAGAFFESTDDSIIYPMDTGHPLAEGVYAGESGMGVGARLKLQYRKLWTHYIETSGFIDWRKSPDFDEARIQATLRIYFEPRNALTLFDVFDRVDLP
jgi:tetratricopeptide (TPR) repeat protein